MKRQARLAPRLYAAATAALVLAALVSACGGGKPAATPTAAPRTVTPTPALTPTKSAAPSVVSLQIASVGNQLLFDKNMLTAPAGRQARLQFDNKGSALQHTWVLVQAGTEEAVANAALAAGAGKGWVPVGDPRVLASTKLLDGGDSGEVVFAAPAPGKYAYICTFPGHWVTMRGTFEVTP